MITLYYTDFSGRNTEELTESCKNKIDAEQYEKAMRIRAPEARVRSLLGGLLLQGAVKEALHSEKEAISLPLRYGPQGKPYLEEYPEIFFNLSHSGTVAICVLCDEEVGVDVQEYRKVRANVAERFFTGEEKEQLRALKADTEEYEKLFFRMWSVKESYIKFTGLGMKQGLDTFGIDWENQQIRDEESGKEVACFQEVSIGGLSRYAVSVCTANRQEIILREIRLD